MYRSNSIHVGDKITASPEWLTGSGIYSITGHVVKIYSRYALVEFPYGIKGCVPVIPSDKVAVMTNKKEPEKSDCKIVRDALRLTGTNASDFSIQAGHSHAWLSGKLCKGNMPESEQKEIADQIWQLYSEKSHHGNRIKMSPINKKVREALIDYDVTLAVLSHKLDVSSTTMSNRLSKNQPEEWQQRMINTIKRIAQERDSHVVR